MARFLIRNRFCCTILGLYDGESAEDAVRAMHQDYGYADGKPPAELARNRLLVELVPTWRVGDRVEAGNFADDYDTGTVLLIDPDDGTVGVAWDRGACRTWEEAYNLRPEGERPVETLKAGDRVKGRGARGDTGTVVGEDVIEDLVIVEWDDGSTGYVKPHNLDRLVEQEEA